MKAALIASSVLCGTFTLAASGQTIGVIYSEIAGDPTSLVPAGAGVPAGTLFQAFDRPYRSPDGLTWILSADTDLATTEDEIIIVGAGFAGATVVREGTMFGTPVVGENVGLIDRNLSITDNGEFAYCTNTDGATTADEYVVRFSGGVFAGVAKEGGAVNGVLGEVYGVTLDSASIFSDGLTVAFRAPSTVGALPTTQDDFLVVGAGNAAQSGVTMPLLQAGGATETWDVFDTEDYYWNGAGTSYIAQGDLTGATTGDDVVVVDNEVRIQEDSLVPGSTYPTVVATIAEIAMDSDGSWYARGNNDSALDWVVRNGDVVASGDEPIVVGTSETYDDTLYAADFFWMHGNSNGDYVVGGVTSNPDVDHDAVLVLNGTTVVARQGDAVDLDGNGINDDDVYVDVFNNDDGFLTDAGLLYFTADVKNGAGVGLGQAYMVVDTNRFAPCPGDIVPIPADGIVSFADLLALLGFWGPCPVPCETSCPGDLNGDCTVDFADLLVLLGAWGPCP